MQRMTGVGQTTEVKIAMSDGVALAATLYLPDTSEPQPCLLEALPYRKDDLTVVVRDVVRVAA